MISFLGLKRWHGGTEIDMCRFKHNKRTRKERNRVFRFLRSRLSRVINFGNFFLSRNHDWVKLSFKMMHVVTGDPGRYPFFFALHSEIVIFLRFCAERSLWNILFFPKIDIVLSKLQNDVCHMTISSVPVFPQGDGGATKVFVTLWTQYIQYIPLYYIYHPNIYICRSG